MPLTVTVPITKMTNIPDHIDDNMVIVTLRYGEAIVVPYSAGTQIFAALTKAEKYTKEYSKPDRIDPFTGENFTITLLSREEYLSIKTKQLLGADNE